MNVFVKLLISFNLLVLYVGLLDILKQLKIFFYYRVILTLSTSVYVRGGVGHAWQVHE